MISFKFQFAGWECHVDMFLKVVDREYVLDDVTYRIDGSRGMIGSISFKMTKDSKGNWNTTRCNLLLSEPFIKRIYPGLENKEKKTHQIKIPKESIKQLLASLTDEYVEKHIKTYGINDLPMNLQLDLEKKSKGL